MVSSQSAELQQIRTTVYELEVEHHKMKERYEDEINRLKQRLQEAQRASAAPQQHRGPGPQQPISQPAPPHQSQPSHQPALGHSSSGGGVFGGMMSGQPPMDSQQQQQQQQQTPQSQQQPVHQGGPAPGPQSQGTPQSQQSQQQQQQSQPYPGYNGYSNSTAGQSSTAGAPQSTQNNGQQKPLTPAPGSNASVSVSPSSKPKQVDIVPTSSSASNGPATGANSGQSAAENAIMLGNNLGDLDIDKVPPELKKQKDDWFVLYNERAPRLLDVEMVQSLDHVSVVCCVRFSLDGKYVATGCNRSAQIFDVQTGRLICKLQDESVDRDGDLYIRSVCFSPDGQYLATGAEDKQIRVWDIKSRTIRYLFTGHEQDIYSLDFSRNGRHIASGSGDRTVRMWDMENGQCVLTLSIEDGVTTVAISPDGRFVAAGSLDKTVRVWDTSTGFLVERLEAPDGHLDSVYSVAFTPNGKDLVSGSLDKTIKLWELQSARGVSSTHKGGVCVRTFTGHKDFVLSVASTPDGQWILSGSKDRGVQFWDPRTAQVQLMLQGHKNSVISVAPSPTGGLFATGSGDCKARIWRYYPYQR